MAAITSLKSALAISLLLLIFAFSTTTHAKTITVDNDGPADFNGIQAAIDSTVDGDIVEVQTGIYFENINFNGKNITLMSTNPTNSDIVNSTTIDGVVCFRGTEDPTCTLSGFNIDGYIVGFDYNYGSDHTHATISHCLLGAIFTPCTPAIFACDGNIKNCVIEYVYYMCTALIPDIMACHGLIENCTILAWIEISGGGTCTLENCIIYKSSIRVGGGATLNVSYCDLEGGLAGISGSGNVNWGSGNIDADPCFVQLRYWDANGIWIDGDYHLLPDSPCINAGDPNCIPEPNETDLDGNPRVIGCRIDMGAFEYMKLVPAEARILPRTINRTSKGNWITCYIWLPEAYNVADSDLCVVLLEYEIEPEQFSFNEEKQIVVARFSHEQLHGILDIGEVKLTISAHLTDGTVFEGTDVIRVIHKASGKPDKYEQASNPDPADGATEVDRNADLSWTSGSYVTSHNVYFGISNPPPFIGNQTAAAFEPGKMDYETKYYWRIDQVNKWGTTTGPVWSFITIPVPPPPPPPP